MLNLMALMEQFKEYSNGRIEDIIKNDPYKREDRTEDNNNITLRIDVNIYLKVAKYMLIITVMSYYIGLSFYIYTDIV